MTDGRVYSLPFDQGVSEIRIMSEAGRININTASNILLQKVIGNLGLQGETRDIVMKKRFKIKGKIEGRGV